jgi:hypothetical protein
MNMKWISYLLALLCMPAFAVEPGSVHASYDVYMSGMKVGQTEEDYSRSGEQYTLTSTTSPQGLLAVFRPEKIHMSSRGLIDKHGLRPLRFEDNREGNPGKSSLAEFDWNQHLLTLTRQSTSTSLPLIEGTQDRLSAMYQFMFLNLENKTALDFAMTNGNKLDDYHYLISPAQKMATPAGKFDVRYLDSQGKTGENRTEIWLETGHNLPCKMIITDAKGEQITQILSGLTILP